MTTLSRRSPKLSQDYSRDAVRDAVNTLEDRPRIPFKTPVSGDDGYDGEICRDATRGYLYTDGAWKYWTLTTL